jgi:Putative adhesin
MLPLLLATFLTATCEKPFEADFRSGGILKLDLRPGEIEIVGSEAPVVRVTCVTKERSEDVRLITVQFDTSGPNAKLEVHGGRNDGLRLRIEVPRRTHLSLNCAAGDVNITRVQGDKDVQMKAGELTIEVGDPADYAEVEASVKAGDLRLDAFATRKDGLLRTFRKSQKNGSYNLRARLWAGNVTLK